MPILIEAVFCAGPIIGNGTWKSFVRLWSIGLDMNIPDNLLQILQLCRTLPSMPAVAMQVLNLSQDPNIGTAKISKVVTRDPALAARILKVANSAWCGVRREVTTLSQAVNLIGLNGTMSLALNFSLVRKLRTTHGLAFDHRMYWRRSAIAATAAVSTCAGRDTADTDEIFLTSLLQDIGMLVLSEALPAYGEIVTSSENDHRMLVEIEHRELNSDHAEVGSWFLARWGLPSRMVEAVRASHRQENIDGMLAKSVAVGGQIADIWINPNIAVTTKLAANAAEALLGLASKQFDEILTATAAELPRTTESLEIHFGDEDLINRLLDQAREAIVEINLRALQEVRNIAVKAHQDALTLVYNRTYLDQMLEEKLNKCRDAGQPMTLIFLDIDEFKSINDIYGHNGGDGVLVSVTQTIRSAVRGQDIIVRFGGDEFVVLLPNADEQAGARVAERIRSMIAQKLHDVGAGNCVHATVSVGFTTMMPDSNFCSGKELLEIADGRLYAAKTAGRNRVA
jgi:diguanylate cyclase (GGDEF)-like protein